MKDLNAINIILSILIILILGFRIYQISFQPENLCIQKDYGFVTDVPASNYVDANMALVHTTSLGQAPLGDPRYWIPNRSPITQGQWGLYQTKTLPLSETQPYDRSKLIDIAKILPVYTQKSLPSQCKPLN